MNIEKTKTKIVNFYNSRKKLVWIGGGILVVIIIAGIIVPAFFGPKDEATVLTYGEVTRGPITETIDVVGALEAVPSASLSWDSGGIIDSFEIKVGDKVSKGDVLMSLTADSLDSSILDAQSSLLDAQTELENLKSANTALYDAAQTLAEAEYNLIDYKADRDYWNYKGSSDESIEAARSAYYAAKQVVWEKEAAYDALVDRDADDPEKVAAYEERKAAIEAQNKALSALNYLLGVYYDYSVETDFIEYDSALAAVEEARVAYNRYLDQSDEIAAAQAAVQALENTINTSKIIAPFDGTITSIDAVAGELVTSGTTALGMDNLDNLEVEVSISEVDINKVMVGQKAIVTFDAISNKEYSGYVESISSSGEEDSNGVVQFSVVAKVEDADDQVKPGFTSVVSIITSDIQDALLVPYDAVVSRDGSYMVVLANKDGSTILVPVEVGAISDLYAQITSGDIEEGDQVVVYESTGADMFSGIMMGGGSMGGGGERPPTNNGGGRTQ